MRRWAAALAACLLAVACGASGGGAPPRAAAPPPAPPAPSPAASPPESPAPSHGTSVAGPDAVAPAASPPAAAPATAEPQSEAAVEPRPTAAGAESTVVIDEGVGEGTPRTLVEAARAERQRRATAGEPMAVITDETLSDYAVGELTSAEPGPAQAPAADAAGAPPGPDGPDLPAGAEGPAAGAEEQWRTRLLDVRTRWHEAVAEIERREGEVAELRRRFYAEDDPYYRDSQIKPAWDLALERLEAARSAAGEAEAELETALAAGREAGAEPGWLREGIDLEPERRSEPGALGDPEDAGIFEAGEPVIVDEDDG